MRIMIEICYDGSEFEGFASQAHGRTVEDTLGLALAKIYKQKVKMYGTSRTDSKVSAKTQYIVFDQPFNIEPAHIVKAINGTVNKAIYCKSAIAVKPNYMPRYDVEYKTYKYTITNEYSPHLRHLKYYIRPKLNVEAMVEASQFLIGTHDFSSFCASNTDVASKVRTVKQLDIEEAGNDIIITISGDGFLYNMVRIITGTLIEIGLGKQSPKKMEEILASKDRMNAYATAPAHGLMLEYIQLKGNYE